MATRVPALIQLSDPRVAAQLVIIIVVDVGDARIVSHLARSDNPNITWVVWHLARSDTPNNVVTVCALPSNRKAPHACTAHERCIACERVSAYAPGV